MSVIAAVKDFAGAAGITERQGWREKRVIAGAERERAAEGAAAIKPEHVRRARAKVNAQRREKAKAPARTKAAPGLVAIQLPRGQAEAVLQILRRAKPASGAQAAAIRAIVAALKR